MDYKIYNIELVNRLWARQHTAFQKKPSFLVVLTGRERESAPNAEEPPPAGQQPLEPLNVTAPKAADLVRCHKVCCLFTDLPPHCRSPPFRLEPQKFRRNGGIADAIPK